MQNSHSPCLNVQPIPISIVFPCPISVGQWVPVHGIPFYPFRTLLAHAKVRIRYNIFCSPIRSNIVIETIRFELQLRTVVAANARPLMGVGNISLNTNQLTTIGMKKDNSHALNYNLSKNNEITTPKWQRRRSQTCEFVYNKGKLYMEIIMFY